MSGGIIKHSKWWFLLSGVMLVTSICLLIFVQLRIGIDFKGGSILEIELGKPVSGAEEIQDILVDHKLSSLTVQPTTDQTIILRLNEIDNETQVAIIETLKAEYQSATLKRFETIGPTIGQELRQKAIYAMIIVLLAIVGYIAYAFRKVSAPIKSWKYGLIAIIALAHDVIIMSGAYVLFGVWFGAEVGSLFIVALLTVLGYSVNDTIIVFDRIRENLSRGTKDSFPALVEKSIRQTITRSLNTALTTCIVLSALLLFGGGTIRDFIAALLVGVIIGTYSSIFLASPLLVAWEKWHYHRIRR